MYEASLMAVGILFGMIIGYFLLPRAVHRVTHHRKRKLSYAKRAATRRANAAAKKGGTPF